MLTKRQRNDFRLELGRKWKIVEQDRELLKIVTKEYGEVDEDTVLETLESLLADKLEKANQDDGEVEVLEVRLVFEEASEAEVTFKGQLKRYEVNGLVRLVGSFVVGGRYFDVKPVWISHPFWQTRSYSGILTV